MTANSSTARTGELGKAVVDNSLVARITQWTANPTVGETAWGDSDSNGYTNRKAGRKDCTGNFQGKFDTTTKVYNLFVAGDTVKLVLWETAADYWAFPCVLIQGFNVSYNVDTQEVVGWQSDYGADGIFYRPGQSGAPTETLPS